SVPAKRLTDIGADYFAWADDGKTITWAIGSRLFRGTLSAISFKPPKDEKEGRGKKEARGEPNQKHKNDSADSASAEKKDEKKEEKKPKKLKEEDKNVEEIAVHLEVPRKTPRGTIVLRGATVVTMKGDEVLRNADIVVENNRIKSV